MKFSLKTLGIGVGVLAVVWAVLHQVDRSIKEPNTTSVKNTRLGPRASGQQQESASKRQLRLRSRKLTTKEATEFLRRTVIPSFSVEDVSLEEALEVFNAKIAEQTEEHDPRPRIRICPNYESAVIERGQSADKSLEEALGASTEMLGESDPNRFGSIAELRVKNIPAEVLLKYVCDASRKTYYVYHGDVYLTANTSMEPSEAFYHDEDLGHIKWEAIRIDHLLQRVDALIDAREYRGSKARLSVQMSEKARQALLSGRISFPQMNIDLKHATLSQLEFQLMAQSHERIRMLPDRQGIMVFDPFDERESFKQADPFAPPGDADLNHLFIIPVDKDWDKPVPLRFDMEEDTKLRTYPKID